MTRASIRAMCEIWKKIPGLSSDYEVSSLGRIRRIDGEYETTYRGKHLVRAKPAKVFALRKKSQKGYCRINLAGKVFFVHRLVATVFVPNPQCAPQVNHKDGNKLNNTSDNLEWVSNYQNRAHAVEHGLHARGPRHKSRKYTVDDVARMQSMFEQGFSLRAIGREFGTSHGTIRKIFDRGQEPQTRKAADC